MGYTTRLAASRDKGERADEDNDEVMMTSMMMGTIVQMQGHTNNLQSTIIREDSNEASDE